ncbi:hypothetical protein [Sinorhizobium medicae]
MKNVHNTIDEARLGIMLNELRLPTIKTLCALPRLNCSLRMGYCLI